MKFYRQLSTRINRNRKTIWLNPPFRQSVETNTGKLFFKLVWKNFLKNDRFKKIFNLNTLNLAIHFREHYTVIPLPNALQLNDLCVLIRFNFALTYHVTLF